MRALGEQLGHVLDDLGQVEVDRLEPQLAGLDLREVEDVVDHREQELRRAVHRLRELALRGASGVSSSRSIMPITPFIGVRISWLMLARNCDFERFASSAWRASATASSVAASRARRCVPRTFASSVRWWSCTWLR